MFTRGLSYVTYYALQNKQKGSASKHVTQVHLEILSRPEKKHGFTLVDIVYYLK